MKDFNINIENNDEWFTPPYITDALGWFDLDPCMSQSHLEVIGRRQNYTKEFDGLSQIWKDRVWCNPPYGKHTFDWIKKLANHGNGIALIFTRTETKGFHAQVWKRANAIFFFKGRLKFYYKNGIEAGFANAPSCLVAYGVNNVIALEKSGLSGCLIKLKETE